MEIYRLANAQFATLDGKGGMYAPGRWHHTGHCVTYAASSRALAVLERFVHDRQALHTPNMKMITIHVPDKLTFAQFFEGDLPEQWDTTLNDQQQDTQELGTSFLVKKQHAFLKVPSAIVPHEFNFILNPLHEEAQRIKIIDKHDYQYDDRYKRMIRE